MTADNENEVERMARALYEAEFTEPPWDMNLQRNRDVWYCRARVALISHPAVAVLREVLDVVNSKGARRVTVIARARAVLASLPKEK